MAGTCTTHGRYEGDWCYTCRPWPVVLTEIRKLIPPRPWRVERYGFSLADVRDPNDNVVLRQLNFAIAEYIVAAVNEKETP